MVVLCNNILSFQKLYLGFVEVMGSVDQGTLFRRATIPIFTFYNYSKPATAMQCGIQSLQHTCIVI